MRKEFQTTTEDLFTAARDALKEARQGGQEIAMEGIMVYTASGAICERLDRVIELLEEKAPGPGTAKYADLLDKTRKTHGGEHQ